MFNTNFKSQKGVTLYFALVVMSIILGIGIGLSVIIFSQIGIVRGIGDSVIALSAADTGIERGLYAIYKEENFSFSTTENLENGASFEVRVYASSSPQCGGSAQYYCIKSIGAFKDTQRAIDASF